MTSTKRILLGVAMTLATVATAHPQYEGASRYDDYSNDRGVERTGYSYVRQTVGDVTVESRLNGRVTARRNMPISAGDEILVSDAGRAEIGLADGNLLFVGGGTRARFSSLYAQQGEDDDFSAIDLREGSVVLAAMGYDGQSIPRIDTEDATVYISAGTRVRVNADRRRGTVVVVRAGSAEVRTRADSYTVEAGHYLMVEGDEPPEVARGVFSRDRFDLWAADQLEYLSTESGRSASVQYVDDDYASDVVALDDYGEWEYSSSYSTNVWVPRVSVGWTPYSHGSWYYTPIGLTWWSYDPWGWYPFHYGSWYFDVGFRSWCWAPAYTYSPAWVYWAYTPRYVGWCPVGYYSFYSPWFDTYYRHWGWNPRHSRASLIFGISGTFRKDQIDFGGWNFVTAGKFGSGYDRLDVIPGTRLVSTLNEQIAISGKPIVVSSRGESLPSALQTFVREAPAKIGRTSKDGSRLAPFLAREKTLPDSTLEVLKGRAVVAGRGKLAGPGAEDFASRGMVVDRSRSVKDVLSSRELQKGSGDTGGSLSRGRKAPEKMIGAETRREAPAASGDVWRGRSRPIEKGEKATSQPAIQRDDKGRGRVESFELREKPIDRSAPAPAAGDWRGRGVEKREKAAPEAAPRQKAPDRAAPAPGPNEEWRGRGVEKREKAAPEAAPRQKAPDRAAPAPRPSDEWRGRSKSDAPPPRIERQKPANAKELSRQENWRGRSDSGSGTKAATAPRAQAWRSGDPTAKRVIEGAVPGRRLPERSAPEARQRAPAEWRQRAPERAPNPSVERRAPKSAPAPREYRPEPQYREPQNSAPREYRQPAPQSRPEPRQYQPREQKAPRAPQYSAPAPRNESRPAPAPKGGSNSKGQARGRKG